MTMKRYLATPVLHQLHFWQIIKASHIMSWLEQIKAHFIVDFKIGHPNREHHIWVLRKNRSFVIRHTLEGRKKLGNVLHST